MHFGASWYPEHWPESRWPRDLALMKRAHFTVVRMGEFAWSTMEPADGRFEFGWLDRAVALCEQAGIDVVLGTPTAAPPAWLTSAHPETLAVGEDGRTAIHGNRCHYRPLSPVYLRYCRRIALEMAKRYGRKKCVIGWQIDNEFNHQSHDEDTRRQFQDWLKVKYRTLARLNDRWSGAYWSEDYQDWRQIVIPTAWGHNPGLRLEWQRFHTTTYRLFQKVQIDAIRRHADRRQWITTNLMGWFPLFDHYQVSRDLDLASWDSYWPTGTPDPVEDALPHDLTRGFKRRNFWLIETQPSSVNWAEINTMHEPGRIRLRNWQAVAHGADAVLYWQWRNALGGQEQLHGSLVGQDGEPRPCFDELAGLGAEFRKAAPHLKGTTTAAEVALVNCYDSRWAVGFQRHHKDYDWVRHFREHYAPFFNRQVGVEVLSSLVAPDRHKLVVAPALWLLHETTAKNLAGFVERGGHLVLTTRTGAKDAENALFPALPPGPLAALAGVAVEDVYPQTAPVEVTGRFKGRAKIWVERLRVAKGTEVLARFGAGCDWVKGRAAVTRRRSGRGSVTTLAGWFEPPLLDAVLADVMKAAGVRPRFSGPPGVEFSVRTDGRGREVVIVMNHSEKAVRLRPVPGRALLAARPRGPWTLAARDVEVFA